MQSYAEKRKLFKAEKMGSGVPKAPEDKIKPFDGNESKPPQIDTEMVDENNHHQEDSFEVFDT